MVGGRRALLCGVIVAIGASLTSPAEAAVPFDGDLVKVCTDKVTYKTWEPILIMAEYLNVGNEAQSLTPLSPGKLETSVSIYPVGGYTPTISYLPLEASLSGDFVYVWPHSDIAVRQKTLVPYTLKAGTYIIFLSFNIKSSTGVYLLQSVASTEIQVQ